MSSKYKNFQDGIGLVPKDISGNEKPGDIEVLSTNAKLNYRNNSSSSPIVTEEHASQGANRLKNKDLDDSTTYFVDSDYPLVKKVKFTVPTTISISELIFPNTISDTLICKNTTDTLTNKTIDLTNNTLITTSAQLASSVTDETGSGLLVFNNTPTITTPVINTINDVLQINNKTGNAINVSSDLTTNFNISGTNNVVQINSSGLTVGTSKRINFNGSSNNISINATTINDTYTISLPSNQPIAGTALYYNGFNYIWQPVFAARKSKYDLIVGSPTEVASGAADYWSLQTAINILTTGGSILLSSNYSTSENITITYDNITIEGQGNKSIINGTLTFPSTADNCSINGVRIIGDITFTVGCKYNMLTNFWASSTVIITDNGTSNYLSGIQE